RRIRLGIPGHQNRPDAGPWKGAPSARWHRDSGDSPLAGERVPLRPDAPSRCGASGVPMRVPMRPDASRCVSEQIIRALLCGLPGVEIAGPRARGFGDLARPDPAAVGQGSDHGPVAVAVPIELLTPGLGGLPAQLAEDVEGSLGVGLELLLLRLVAPS